MLLPFMQFAQIRELRPYIRFAHYTADAMRVPSRFIHDHEFILIDEGKGTIFTEAGEFTYEPGSLLLIPPGSLHSFRDSDETGLAHAHYAVHFDWERRNDGIVVEIVGEQDGPVDPEDWPAQTTVKPSLWVPDMIKFHRAGSMLKERFARLVGAYQSGDAYRQLEMQGLFIAIVMELIRRLERNELAYELATSSRKVHKPTERADITQFIMKLHDAVKESPVDETILSKWQETVYFSPPHFLRLFKEQTGRTPLEYFTRLRMEKAALSLLETDQAVQDIAFACGYDNSKYFSRLFRQYEGLSPKQYRAAYLPSRTARP